MRSLLKTSVDWQQGEQSSMRVSEIRDGVILMAGSGSRFNGTGGKLLKPLLPIAGRPLVSYTLDAFVAAGIERIHAVVGFEAKQLTAAVRSLAPSCVDLRFIHNSEWKKQNGVSLLAAAAHVNAPFLLTMGDHLFEQSVFDALLSAPANDGVTVAIDRKLESIFDIDDAMKVCTRGDHVVAIGKHLSEYDAIDTGMFLCAPGMFDFLERAKRNGDCSLADGIRMLAPAGKARVVDIGPAWWQDVDTPEMLSCAEKKLRARPRLADCIAVAAGSGGSDSV